MRPKFGPRVV
jgi:hypothetical protein